MRWLLAFTLVGCSQWFGLSNAPSDDPDGDHIPSESDNCPTVYNPDQSDLDGNGIGDACDTCGFAGGSDDDDDGDGIPNECDACDNRDPDTNGDGVPDSCETLTGCTDCAPCALGPAHDEDGDKIADACDPCAIDPMTSQDIDSDGVGDTCDASTNKPSHQLFDPFAEPNQDWYETGAGGWTVKNDVLRIQTTINGAASYRLLGTGFNHFVIRTQVSGTAGATAELASLVAIRGTLLNPDETFVCTITFAKEPTAPSLSLTHNDGPVDTNSTPVTLPDVNKYDLVLDIDPSLTGGIATCTATTAGSNVPRSTTSNAPNVAPYLTGLRASGSGSTTFQYFQFATDN